MRVLFTTTGGMGNFNPLVPLARALRDQGDQVLFATPARFGPAVRAAGFEAIPAGLDMTYRDYLERLLPLPPGANEVAEVFMKGLAGPMLVDLLRIIPTWQPDLLIHEVVEFGGPTASEILNIPHVVHNLILIGYSPETLDFLVRDEYAAFRQANGLSPDPQYRQYFRYLYLHHIPERITPLPRAIVAQSQLIRPEFPDANVTLPAWAEQLAALPTVYVTLGTVVNGTPGVIETMLEALGQGEFNLIVTVGNERDPSEFGSQPQTVHIERYIPQAAILPYCDLVVCHGGTGTLLGALAHGLPLLIVPLSSDQFPSAERLSAREIAQVLHAPELNVQTVRSAVQHLLANPVYREHASQVKQDIAAMPSPHHVAQMLAARLPTWRDGPHDHT